MSFPAPNGPPRSDSPAWISRLEWPSHETIVPVPGMGFQVRIINRANGNVGISPLPTSDEREVDRFIAQWLRALFPVGADGLPLSDPTRAGELKEICSGGAEVLLTDRRMAIVVVKGNGVLGRVEDQHGSIMAIDLPYRALGSVAIVRKRKKFGGIKEHSICSYTSLPPGVVDIEPLARIDSDIGNPARVGFAEFADAVVRSACADALNVVLMEASERKRLEAVRQGARNLEDLDIVAEIAR